MRPETCEDMDFYHLPCKMQDISAYFQNIAAKHKPIGGKRISLATVLKDLKQNRSKYRKKNIMVIPWDPFLHHPRLRISYSGSSTKMLPGTKIFFCHEDLSTVVVKNSIIAFYLATRIHHSFL